MYMSCRTHPEAHCVIFSTESALPYIGVALQHPAQQGRVTIIKFNSDLFPELHFSVSAIGIFGNLGICRKGMHEKKHPKIKDFGHSERQGPSA